MDIVIGFDVGGTNSRATIARVESGTLMSHSDFPTLISEKVASKKELREFIGSLLSSLPHTDRPIGAALALAGPIAHHREVVMTNWPDPKNITIEEFVEWGLPANRTVMANDMEAGCYGLAKRIQEDKSALRHFEQLKESSISLGEIPKGNRVFIAPGTGLGAAGIIQETEGGQIYPIAVELQHTPMPVLQEVTQTIAVWLHNHEHIVYPHPSWEDFVSGRGLANAYRALRAARSVSTPDVTIGVTDPAGAVAKAGMMGTDACAEQALSVFYTCAGYFCQLMALGFQAFGGVFIGGTSTIKNRDFIPKSPLVSAFSDNPTQQSLLDQFPIYLVKESDLNLDGALWLGLDASRK
uniref:Glucokinase n=1 Tax=Candidatus Kentrum sp. FW TaxID=2126338 RepID=A0A450SB06_9GAMM|nr:MAG: glucokinase [Candidatus Kentron sp. FW]